jgi:beta-lactamase class A
MTEILFGLPKLAILLSFCNFCGLMTPPEGEPQVRAAALALVRALQPGPTFAATGILEPDLLREIGPAKWAEHCRELTTQHGRARQARGFQMRGSFVAEFSLVFEKSVAIPVLLRTTPLPPFRIAGLRFGQPVFVRDSWDQVRVDLSRLPGITAAMVSQLHPAVPPLLACQARQPLAVASTFKLLVAVTLADAISAGKRKWADVIATDWRWRSLPSGWLQDWPNGSPVTLHTLAAFMLARSDNTAADHLLHILGRETVEAGQLRLALDAGQRNRPFLTTGEMFRLKLIAERHLRQQYLEADISRRRQILAQEVASLNLASAVPLTRPVLLADIDWQFSAADLARLADELRRSPQADVVLPLLALQPPFAVDTKVWTYVGYKGGSECGVQSAVVLLRHHSGAWFAVSLIWNNSETDVDTSGFFELLDRIVFLIELNLSQSDQAPKSPGKTP